MDFQITGIKEFVKTQVLNLNIDQLRENYNNEPNSYALICSCEENKMIIKDKEKVYTLEGINYMDFDDIKILGIEHKKLLEVIDTIIKDNDNKIPIISFNTLYYDVIFNQ